MLTCLFLLALEVPFPHQPDIYLEIHGNALPASLVLLAPHGSESVANEYVAERVAARGGRFVVLRQRDTRHVHLKIEDREFELDPNRMFTPAGARASLLAQNPDLDEDSPLWERALERAVALGAFVIEHLNGFREGTTILAIHNNTNGFDDDGKGGVGTVSIERYRRKLGGGARFLVAVHVGEGDEDDLFFVTEREDHERMADDDWHVVLQNPAVRTLPDQDDGSLSVFAEMRGLRYINIEAERAEGDHGEDHLEVQRRMVDYAFDLVLADE